MVKRKSKAKEGEAKRTKFDVRLVSALRRRRTTTTATATTIAAAATLRDGTKMNDPRPATVLGASSQL
ncbi:hypothetical protein E2C01_079538 [Portunus trituberculatus]|uniref:Uncharacterized protein n=1 Tax=Portunus trituberculatus TaxID=210409 RepID=A0A5B7IVW4_PORTR|nr:hypothetical protein [Portunus trituberculatus]